MNLNVRRWIKGLKKLFSTRQPESSRQAERIVAMQLHVVLPAKVGVIGVVSYYIFHYNWLSEQETIREVAVEVLRRYFAVFVFLNFVAFLMFLFWRRLPPGLFQQLAFTLGVLDGLFVAGLTFLTGGFESIVYWVFPGLIVLNALSIPLAVPQIVLNLSLSAFYLAAGVLDIQIPISERANISQRVPRATGGRGQTTRTNVVAPLLNTNPVSPSTGSNPATQLANTNRYSRPATMRGIESPYLTMPDEKAGEPLPKLFVLWLLAACSYGVQVLARRTIDEERELAVRAAQLHSAGRLAAEFAHQIKNPLAIINNAAFSMRRALKEGSRDVSRQIDIIQEEVEHSDRIVTQVIGYAQLIEGRVEKLDVGEELDRAIAQVFPPAVDCGVRVERRYSWELPPLFMHRRHLEEIMVNLLRNAREALNDHGIVSVTATLRSNDSIEISVHDNGPGIPPDKLERVFEAYYSTREKGSGLGLAIVKNHTELYAGTVRVESELGKGSRFIVTFPAKTAVGSAKPR